MLSLTGISTLLGFLAPVLAYLSPLNPSQLGSAEFQTANGTAIPPDEIAEGTAKIGTLSGRPTLIIRKSGQLLAYDALCTHLGCIVKWDAQESSIECPCHGGVFASNGKVVAGPPP
ncbi:MAG: Rieske 2Fe-2S domain-containing protein, partial [Candidatus Latescibacterota bacterium]|nr:Rieske 2Fe-2S domain-containing protein [Candidatus Latescibacterota bacterium]